MFYGFKFLRMKLSFVLCSLFIGVLTKHKLVTYPAPKNYRPTPYDPFVISKTCLLKPDEGPCRGNIKMYYYDQIMQNCSTFYWGGCQGNGNRFERSSECTQFCVSPRNMDSNRPRYCMLSFDYGFCFGSAKRWYYDKYWKTCKERIYSGCGGNKNNFHSLEQCEQICRFGKPPLKARGYLRTQDTEKSFVGNSGGANVVTENKGLNTTGAANISRELTNKNDLT